MIETGEDKDLSDAIEFTKQEIVFKKDKTTLHLISKSIYNDINLFENFATGITHLTSTGEIDHQYQ